MGTRINKYLADCGICSRREADKYIEEGLVYLNGRIAVNGDKVDASDEVKYKGKIISPTERFVLLAYNKPVGVECTTDKDNKDNIIKALGYKERVFYIGRLDKNSRGLILLTNDGMLCNSIAKSVNNHEKEYIVKVNKKITDEFLDKMSRGVRLHETRNGKDIINTVTKPCKIKKIDDYTFNIILTQGLNRQIRRMCKAFSYTVVDLKRIRVININIDNLKEGAYRECSEKEIRELKESVELK